MTVLDQTLISIVIVNWNSGPLLERCVQSLLGNAPGCQLILVDNASADGSLAFAQNLDRAELSIVRNDRNAGFAAGNNQGWQRSQGDRILFLNPDTECLPGSVSCLEHTLAADPGVWAAGGHLFSPTGKSQEGFNVRPFPTIGRVAAEMLLIDRIGPAYRTSGARPAAGEGEAVDVDQPAAACLMVNRAALDSLGGFDETFHPAWFEDVDLCRRIRNRGGRIQYQPQARFAHHGGYSLGRLHRQDFLEIFHTNQIRYFRKHHGPQTASRAKRLIFAGLMFRSALSIIRSPVPGMKRSDAARMFRGAARRVVQLREAQL